MCAFAGAMHFFYLHAQMYKNIFKKRLGCLEPYFACRALEKHDNDRERERVLESSPCDLFKAKDGDFIGLLLKVSKLLNPSCLIK